MTWFDFGTIYSEVQLDRFQNGETRMLKLNSVKPSQITTCLRKQFFNTVGGLHEQTDVHPAQTIFDHGNLIHDDFVAPVLQYWMEKVNRDPYLTIINEARLRHYYKGLGDIDPCISGYVDNLIIQTVRDARSITGYKELFSPIEIKSINERGYNKLRKPKFDHLVQTIMYMGCFDSRYGYITYINKHTLDSKTYTIFRDKEEYESQEDKFRAVWIDVDGTFELMKRRGAKLVLHLEDEVVPPAEMKIEKNSELYNKLIEEGYVLASKDEHETLYGYECTRYCDFVDECGIFGLKR